MLLKKVVGEVVFARTPEVSAATVACLPCFGVDVQGFPGEHSCLSAKTLL